MTLRRSTALVALTAAACAAAATTPALAQTASTTNVGVTLSTSSAGTRQFDVIQEGSTATLSSLDLTNGAQTFRTRVSDTGLDALGKDYSVNATMSNLYLKKSDGSYDVATKIPSAQLSMSKAALTADSLLLDVLPSLSVSGTLPTCASLDDTTKTALGLGTGATALLSGVTGPLLDLCTALESGAKPFVATVDGTVQQVTATVTDLAKLPTALSNGSASAFTVADYTQDATGKTDPDKGGTATAVNVMTGAAASALPTDLVTTIAGQLTGRIATLPLASADGTGALTRSSTLLAGTSDSTLAGLLGALDSTQLTTLLNEVTGKVVTAAAPVLSRVKVTTKYYGKPTLSVNLDAPVAGTYDGTLTLTFVQN